jgi:hypothetical protein
MVLVHGPYQMNGTGQRAASLNTACAPTSYSSALELPPQGAALKWPVPNLRTAGLDRWGHL